MRIIKADDLIEIISDLAIKACYHLPDDIKQSLDEAYQDEQFPRAKQILGQIIDNYQLAAAKQIPICQDTGLACVFVEIGRQIFIDGNLDQAINQGIRQGYQQGFLRKSVVSDPLRRTNSGDNTPAMIYYDFVDGDKLSLTIAPKGFGSENMSRLKMLKPSDGIAGIKDFVLETVKLAASNPCPPIMLGIGLGGNFDKAALLAKKALLLAADYQHPDPYYQDLAAQLLKEINDSGIGPQGLGGKTTALAVNILTMPTHIAGLPLAVNINCHASRHQNIII